MSIQINFAPNTRERSFLLNGGSRELLLLAEQYLEEVDSVSLMLYKGYVFSYAQGERVVVYTSIENLRIALNFVKNLDVVYVELITKSRQYLLTCEMRLVVRDDALIKQVPIAKYMPLFLAAEFGGWINGDVRKKNWETLRLGFGPFRTVLIAKGCVITFNCFIRSGKINGASISLSRKSRPTLR
ncbi:hypothetical protein [Cellvibrio sp.]|uniref:hypothetical protein n=1 Tax=Cellvibrio sp. TaxID=1965322 RepID=UPI0039647802